MLIPVSKPSIGEKELAYAKDALDSGWISSKGDYIDKFEHAWASYNGYRYGASCNSGTNALLLALRALGIGKGDEVIVPEFTMVATAWAVTYCGATPVFIDCKDDLTIDESLIEQALSKKTKAIIPVHIYGRKCAMEEIVYIAKEHNLFIVEDMAEAHGITPVSDIACYSFYGNKIITTGEGGMCLTDDYNLYTRLQYLKSMSFDKDHLFLHNEIGYNFRMTNVQAAIGFSQVERIDEILDKRDMIEKWYEYYLLDKYKMSGRSVLWMYDVKVDNQQYIIDKLKEKGIETRMFFKPMSMQPMYLGPYEHLNAYRWSKRGIYLPTFTNMTEEEVKYVCDIINNI